MWVMKITVPYMATTLIGSLTKKHGVVLSGYPISSNIQKDHVDVITSGILLGEPKDRERFCKALKKDRRTLSLEVKGSFLISRIKQALENRYVFQQGVIFVKPAIVTKEGEYLFELGAWEKERLTSIIKVYKPWKVKLHWMKQKKIANVQIMSVQPDLTGQQRKCLQVAIDNSYYDYPRKIDLKTLAKIAGLSYSTYQYHLRVAEKKVMPLLVAGI